MANHSTTARPSNAPANAPADVRPEGRTKGPAHGVAGRPMTELRVADHRSRFAIRRHPIHPMLIPFPIAFLTGARTG